MSMRLIMLFVRMHSPQPCVPSLVDPSDKYLRQDVCVVTLRPGFDGLCQLEPLKRVTFCASRVETDWRPTDQAKTEAFVPSSSWELRPGRPKRSTMNRSVQIGPARRFALVALTTPYPIRLQSDGRG